MMRPDITNGNEKHIIADKHPDINTTCEPREQTVLTGGNTGRPPGAELLQTPQPTANRESDPRNRPWLIWVVSFGVWSIVALTAGGTVYTLYRATHTPMSFAS